MPADPTTNPVLNRASRPHTILSAVAAVGLATGAALPARADTITEPEAHAIGVDAYVYFYPLVTMDITRRQLTNAAAGAGFGHGPMNAISNVPAYPAADDRVVVRPNFDTLYSVGYLDLTKEPMVVSVPDTHGRYYLLPMLDMWSDVFASPGWRTTGTQAGNFLVAPPGWRPDLRARFAEEFKLPPARGASMRRRHTCGSSGAPRPTAPLTTTPCTRSRPATRSRRSRDGASLRSRSQPYPTPGST